MLTFQVEPVDNVWNEMVADWKTINNEVLNLSRERYVEYERIGFYIQYVARYNEKAIGYLGAYLTYSMRNQQLIAVEDFAYIKPEYRKGRITKRFGEYIEKDLKARGVIKITCTVKPESVANRLLEHMNYQITMYQLEKQLT